MHGQQNIKKEKKVISHIASALSPKWQVFRRHFFFLFGYSS